MKYLLKRMLRDIRINFGKFISIVLILGVGSFVFSGLLSSVAAISSNVSSYYEAQNLADLWCYYSSTVDSDKIDSLIENEFIDDAELRYSYTIKLNDNDSKLYGYGDISMPYLMQGEYPINEYEVLIDNSYALNQNYIVGDTILISYNATNYNLKITGFCIAPDFAYKTKTATGGSVSTNQFALIFTKNETLKAINPLIEFAPYSEVLIKTLNTDKAITFLESTENYYRVLKRSQVLSYSMVENSINPIKSVVTIIPFVFYFVAAIVTFISMTKAIENDRNQIAIMQAIGVSKRKIAFSYLFYGLMASVLGSFVFSLIGNYTLCIVLINCLTGRFNLPKFIVPFYWKYALAGFGLSVVFCCIAILVSLVRVLREIPAQAMRPRPPKKSHKTIVEKMPRIWNKLKYSSKLNVRNIFLGKMRLFLTSIGVIGGVGLLIMSFSLSHAVDLIIDPIIDRYNYDISISYKNPIVDAETINFGNYEIKFQEKALQIPCIKDQESEEDIIVQVVEKNSEAIRLTSDKDSITFTDTSFAISQLFANTYHLSIGDDFSFVYNGQTKSAKISNITNECMGTFVYISYPYAESLGLNTTTNSLLVKLVSISAIDKFVEYVKNLDDVSGFELSQDTVKMANEYTRLLNMVVLITIIAAAVLTITVVYNITTINIFDRTREFATLMVLGYYKKEVYHLIIIENILISIIGCILGVPLGVLLFKTVRDAICTMSITMPFIISIKYVFVCIGLTFVFSLIALLLCRKKINKIQMVEALKSIE